eukprot:TRINITY_DN5180_c0_g1_i1.p1 TRINITY_DN5180_c0_g1~~TRINITY_DN5180_c0_g1_i1.p1  ORF type:complete len:507 (-),score=228.76 TRINITY_DN5180_c0_g1_i1:705-2225(-)
MSSIPYIGSKISLISKSESRYEGILYTIDTEKSTIALQNVRSFGTEGRRKDGEQIAPMNDIYDYIIFKVSDIKDLYVCEAPPPQPVRPNDPAIIHQQMYGGYNQFPPNYGVNPQYSQFGGAPNPNYGAPYGNYGGPYGYPTPYQNQQQPPVQGGAAPQGVQTPAGPASGQVRQTQPAPNNGTVLSSTTTTVQSVPSSTLPPSSEKLGQKDEKLAGNKQNTSVPPANSSVIPPTFNNQQPLKAPTSSVPSSSNVLPPHLATQGSNLTSQVAAGEPVVPDSVDLLANGLQSQHLSQPQNQSQRGGRGRGHPAGQQNVQRNQQNNNPLNAGGNNRPNNNNRRQGERTSTNNNQNRTPPVGTKFTEDFDFESANSRFEKEKPATPFEVSDDDLAALTPPTPAYEKSSFFDNISCESTDRKESRGRASLSEQRKLDAETFGSTGRPNRGRGGPRRYNNSGFNQNNQNNNNQSGANNTGNRQGGGQRNFRPQSDGRPTRGGRQQGQPGPNLS